MMASSCVYLIPVAATNQPPKIPVSSIHDMGGSVIGGGRIGRGMLSGVSSAMNAAASPSFMGRRCLLNRKFEPTTTRFRCNSQLFVDVVPATAAAYGVLLISGGLFAYKRSGSKGSLIGGLTGGSLMAAAYFLMQATDRKELGEALAFGSTLLFASVFGIRLAATRKITPAGPLLGLSIFALAIFISAYLQDSV